MDQTDQATHALHPRSHLFTVRVWEETIGASESEWRGKVHLTTTGDVRYFRHWESLATLLPAMLAESEPTSHASQPDTAPTQPVHNPTSAHE